MPTGQPSHSKEEWEMVRPIFYDLYIIKGYTLEEAMMLLELNNGFRASEDAFNKRKQRYWPECKKNKKCAEGQTPPQAKRERPNKIDFKHAEYPLYIEGRILNPVPRSLTPILYESHTLLLHSINKYTRGFFDSTHNEQHRTKRDPEKDTWYRVLIRCREISTITRKKEDLVLAETERPFRKTRSKAKMNEIMFNLLDKDVFDKLPGIATDSSPHDLPSFWGICRILRGMSFQLGHCNHCQGLLMRYFVEKLHESLSQVNEGHNIEMREFLKRLLDISPVELRDMTRKSLLCATRALSSRLGPSHPVVLQAWTDYYQHWDSTVLNKEVFIQDFRKAYSEIQRATEANRETSWSDDDKLSLLTNYSYFAHYVCHDNDLAQQLAIDLWNRTGATLEEDDTPEYWTWTVHGMVEAARMQALLCYVNHENKLKNRRELKQRRKELNLRSKRARRRYRKEALEAKQQNHESLTLSHGYSTYAPIIFALQETVNKLASSEDQDLQFLATELYELLEYLIRTDTKTPSFLRISVDRLEKSADQDCQLLAAGLASLQASLALAVAQDTTYVQRSFKALLSRKKRGALFSTVEIYNLSTFLEHEIKVRKEEGEKYRSIAKDLRWVVVGTSEFMEF